MNFLPLLAVISAFSFFVSMTDAADLTPAGINHQSFTLASIRNATACRKPSESKVPQSRAKLRPIEPNKLSSFGLTGSLDSLPLVQKSGEKRRAAILKLVKYIAFISSIAITFGLCALFIIAKRYNVKRFPTVRVEKRLGAPHAGGSKSSNQTFP